MNEAAPSRTALRVAVRRAAHQILDHPVVFEDALALSMIGAEEASKLKSLALRPETMGSPGLRAFLAVRSRFAEDELTKAVDQGVTQYVVLGAGLDTFAYRSPLLHTGLKVFEVDHPATQQWKRDQLRASGIAVPSGVVFVPVNFESQDLKQALEQAGFQMDERTCFSWLGVAPYLTGRAFDETLSFIAAMPEGSGVVFDYAVSRSSLNAAEQRAFDLLADRVAAEGEPFQLFFEPEELAQRLRRIGFRHIEDLGGAQLNARYLPGRQDGLQIRGNLGHLVSARV
ncbi:MAG: class I SAM-dependent methyltransferase [Acidobacteriales bacterium]|nr:class I SAM-dependent methyltransferase [Terriglobales bacterium]